MVITNSETVVIPIKIDSVVDDGTIEVLAAKPMARRNSYSGSRLLYPSLEMAFEGVTPTKIKLNEHNEAVLTTHKPSPYYLDSCVSDTIVPSQITVTYYSKCVKKETIIRLSS